MSKQVEFQYGYENSFLEICRDIHESYNNFMTASFLYREELLKKIICDNTRYLSMTEDGNYTEKTINAEVLDTELFMPFICNDIRVNTLFDFLIITLQDISNYFRPNSRLGKLGEPLYDITFLGIDGVDAVFEKDKSTITKDTDLEVIDSTRRLMNFAFGYDYALFKSLMKYLEQTKDKFEKLEIANFNTKPHINTVDIVFNNLHALEVVFDKSENSVSYIIKDTVLREINNPIYSLYHDTKKHTAAVIDYSYRDTEKMQEVFLNKTFGRFGYDYNKNTKKILSNQLSIDYINDTFYEGKFDLEETLKKNEIKYNKNTIVEDIKKQLSINKYGQHKPNNYFTVTKDEIQEAIIGRFFAKFKVIINPYIKGSQPTKSVKKYYTIPLKNGKFAKVIEYPDINKLTVDDIKYSVNEKETQWFQALMYYGDYETEEELLSNFKADVYQNETLEVRGLDCNDPTHVISILSYDIQMYLLGKIQKKCTKLYQPFNSGLIEFDVYLAYPIVELQVDKKVVKNFKELFIKLKSLNTLKVKDLELLSSKVEISKNVNMADTAYPDINWLNLDDLKTITNNEYNGWIDLILSDTDYSETSFLETIQEYVTDDIKTLYNQGGLAVPTRFFKVTDYIINMAVLTVLFDFFQYKYNSIFRDKGIIISTNHPEVSLYSTTTTSEIRTSSELLDVIKDSMTDDETDIEYPDVNKLTIADLKTAVDNDYTKWLDSILNIGGYTETNLLKAVKEGIIRNTKEVYSADDIPLPKDGVFTTTDYTIKLMIMTMVYNIVSSRYSSILSNDKIRLQAKYPNVKLYLNSNKNEIRTLSELKRIVGTNSEDLFEDGFTPLDKITLSDTNELMLGSDKIKVSNFIKNKIIFLIDGNYYLCTEMLIYPTQEFRVVLCDKGADASYDNYPVLLLSELLKQHKSALMLTR